MAEAGETSRLQPTEARCTARPKQGGVTGSRVARRARNSGKPQLTALAARGADCRARRGQESDYAAVSDLTTETLTLYPNPAKMRTSKSLDT